MPFEPPSLLILPAPELITRVQSSEAHDEASDTPDPDLSFLPVGLSQYRLGFPVLLVSR